MPRGNFCSGFKIDRKYRYLFKESFDAKRPTDEAIQKHFERLRTLVENATSLEKLDSFEELTNYSHYHFSNLIPLQDKCNRREILDDEHKKTLEKISEKNEELRTLSEETGIHAQAGVYGFKGGVGLGKKKEKMPPH